MILRVKDAHTAIVIANDNVGVLDAQTVTMCRYDPNMSPRGRFPRGSPHPPRKRIKILATTMPIWSLG